MGERQIQPTYLFLYRSYLFFFTAVVAGVETGVLAAFALENPPGCLFNHKNNKSSHS